MLWHHIRETPEICAQGLELTWHDLGPSGLWQPPIHSSAFLWHTQASMLDWLHLAPSVFLSGCHIFLASKMLLTLLHIWVHLCNFTNSPVSHIAFRDSHSAINCLTSLVFWNLAANLLHSAYQQNQYCMDAALGFCCGVEMQLSIRSPQLQRLLCGRTLTQATVFQLCALELSLFGHCAFLSSFRWMVSGLSSRAFSG